MNIEIIPLMEGLSNATLKAFIQQPSLDNKSLGKRPAVIICPGGAYLGINEKESDPVALKFLSAGYHSFVLQYSVGTEMARFPMPFLDVAKAVMTIRQNAGRWCVDSDKIVLCGFSAGGYLAATLAATWREAYFSEALNAESQTFKPNALILGYSLLDIQQFKIQNMMKNPEMQPLLDMIFTTVYGSINPDQNILNRWSFMDKISSDMPPTFLWNTSEDALIDIDESLSLVKALSKNNISYEFHIFEKGAHGLSLGDQTVGYSEAEMQKHLNTPKWIDLALNWLKSL